MVDVIKKEEGFLKIHYLKCKKNNGVFLYPIPNQVDLYNHKILVDEKYIPDQLKESIEKEEIIYYRFVCPSIELIKKSDYDAWVLYWKNNKGN